MQSLFNTAVTEKRQHRYFTQQELREVFAPLENPYFSQTQQELHVRLRTDYYILAHSILFTHANTHTYTSSLASSHCVYADIRNSIRTIGRPILSWRLTCSCWVSLVSSLRYWQRKIRSHYIMTICVVIVYAAMRLIRYLRDHGP